MKVGGAERLQRAVAENRIRERGGMFFFPHRVLGDETIIDMETEKQFDIGSDDELAKDLDLREIDIGQLRKDPLCLMEADIDTLTASGSGGSGSGSSNRAPLALTDGTAVETDQMDQFYNLSSNLHEVLTRPACSQRWRHIFSNQTQMTHIVRFNGLIKKCDIRVGMPNQAILAPAETKAHNTKTIRSCNRHAR